MRSPQLQGVNLAIAPLGTSNDVSRSVGWGSFKHDYWKHDAYVPNMLATVGAGIPVLVDCWQLRVSCDKSKSLIGSDLPASFTKAEQVGLHMHDCIHPIQPLQTSSVCVSAYMQGSCASLQLLLAHKAASSHCDELCNVAMHMQWLV